MLEEEWFCVVGNKEESTAARDSFVMNVVFHTLVIFTFLESNPNSCITAND